MSTMLEKLDLYKDFIHEQPIVVPSHWNGELVIHCYDLNNTSIAKQIIPNEHIHNAVMRTDGGMSFNIVPARTEWFLNTDGHEIKSVELLMYAEKDSHLSKFPDAKHPLRYSTLLSGGPTQTHVFLEPQLDFPVPPPF